MSFRRFPIGLASRIVVSCARSSRGDSRRAECVDGQGRMRERRGSSRIASAGAAILLSSLALFVARAETSASDAAVDELTAPSQVTQSDGTVPVQATILAPRVAPVVTPEKPGILSYLSERTCELFRTAFLIERPEIEGNYRLSSSSTRRMLGLSQPRWIWDLPLLDLATLFDESPWADGGVATLGMWPARLKLDVKEAEPWLVVQQGQSSWLFSRTERLLQPLSAIDEPELIMELAELPRLDGIQFAPAGEGTAKTESSLRFRSAVRMVRSLELAGGIPFPVSRYALLPDGGLRVESNRPQDPELKLAPTSFPDAVVQLRHLREVLADLRARNERVKSIDLRFDSRAILS
ncbi:MAG: hypothetical protein IT290_02150 [Deltaproteobacteria bacterium]|nr:hypothetical protein [Deltaproteobacteria bacterium]